MDFIEIDLEYLDDGQGGVWPLMTADERAGVPEQPTLADFHAKRVEQDAHLRATCNVLTITAVCRRPDRALKSIIDATAYAKAAVVATAEGGGVDTPLFNMFRAPLQLEKCFDHLKDADGGLDTLPDALETRLVTLFDTAIHPTVSVTRFLSQSETPSDAVSPLPTSTPQ